MPALRRLYRIDIAYDVRDRHIGRGELLYKSIIAMNPIDLHLVAVQLTLLTAIRAPRREWIVVDFRAGYDGNLGVEQVGQLPNDPRLRLAAKTKENEIVFCENCINDLRYDGFVVTQYSRKQAFAASQFLYQIRAHL